IFLNRILGSFGLHKNKQETTVVENTNLPVEIKKETFFKKLISFIKGLFNKTNMLITAITVFKKKNIKNI
ncbi:MAG: hypothetical protein ACI4VE_01740, partial [Clostridia bacterium]